MMDRQLHIVKIELDGKGFHVDEFGICRIVGQGREKFVIVKKQKSVYG